MTIKFTATPEEYAHIFTIVNAYKSLCSRRRITLASVELLTLTMDLTATHANGCPLRLADMAEAARAIAAGDYPPYALDVLHDIIGIQLHINRTTGVLDGHFLPRFAARATEIRS